MRRLLIIAACTAAACGAIFARSGRHALPSEVSSSGLQAGPVSAASGSDTKIIDLKSDLSGPVAPGDSVIFLVGNFAAQHNGAVITCDSAVRYSDKRIEFFGNVLINKNTTYIYGDRADYNGEINEARVYSEIIKVVDGDATLYTYRFRFNTKDNVGEFSQGGVLTNRDNVLESVRGYYYADTKELAAVDQVEMRNEEYELKGDSVVYNMATDNAFFFDRTNIWSHDGNYLYADRGEYRKADTLYVVTRNGYVLTREQEMWSDSIDFYRADNHVILRRDVQIDDAPHKVLAFADYGEYWREPGNAFLTRDPSLVSYDLSQGDSLFMRADSMFLYTIRWEDEKKEQAMRRSPGVRRAGAGPIRSGRRRSSIRWDVLRCPIRWGRLCCPIPCVLPVLPIRWVLPGPSIRWPGPILFACRTTSAGLCRKRRPAKPRRLARKPLRRLKKSCWPKSPPGVRPRRRPSCWPRKSARKPV